MANKALVVGINAYPRSPLRGCVNDAGAMADLLARNGDGSINFATQLVKDVPTQGQLRAMIEKLFQDDEDMALFYFSGHGLMNHLGGFIVTPDHQKYDEGLAMDKILTIAGQSKIKNKIIILDCCHSGAMGTVSYGDFQGTYLDEGTVILTASRDTEESLEVNGRGVFTSLLIDALEGGAADILGRVTPGSVYAYIDQALGPWDQRPVFKTNVTRFMSLRNVKPEVALDVLRKLTEYFTDPLGELPLDPSYEYTNTDVAVPEKVAAFKNLQKFESVGLVKPVGEEHMYWAAQNHKSCQLTPLGFHYWRLVKNGRI